MKIALIYKTHLGAWAYTDKNDGIPNKKPITDFSKRKVISIIRASKQYTHYMYQGGKPIPLKRITYNDIKRQIRKYEKALNKWREKPESPPNLIDIFNELSNSIKECGPVVYKKIASEYPQWAISRMYMH